MQATIIVICKDDPAGIEKTLQSIAGTGAEFLLYDVSNTFSLEMIALRYGAKLYRGEWEGYGHVRFKAACLASHDLILMLHAGETIDEELKGSIRQIDPGQKMIAYKIRFKNIFCNRWMRHGEAGRYAQIRIGNRQYKNLFNGTVQEEIFHNNSIHIKNLKGHILHSPIIDLNQYARKIKKDALIAAVRYYREHKKFSVLNLLFSPVIAFTRNYFFKLGFLDGEQGFVCAKMSARYTYLKYFRLRELKHSLPVGQNSEGQVHFRKLRIHMRKISPANPL